MAEVFWFKVKDEASGDLRTYPKKGVDQAIARLDGAKMWGSAEEVDDQDLDADGLYVPPQGRLHDLSPQNRALIERLAIDIDKGDDWDRVDITGVDLNRALDAAREEGPGPAISQP
jgi:hypothetical protein